MPPGYKRVAVPPGSFSEWLRTLPMAPEGTPAKSFDGKETLELACVHVGALAQLHGGQLFRASARRRQPQAQHSAAQGRSHAHCGSTTFATWLRRLPCG